LPAFVVAEQIRWLPSRDRCDSKTSGEATLGSPFQEVADSVAALRFLLVQPAIEIVLAQLLERHSLLVDPGVQLKGNQDPATQLTPR
jgi:hypothetical protein